MNPLEDIVYWMYESSGNSKYKLAGRKDIGPDEARQQIKDLFDGIIFESEEPGGPKSLRSYEEITEMLEAL